MKMKEEFGYMIDELSQSKEFTDAQKSFYLQALILEALVDIRDTLAEKKEVKT